MIMASDINDSAQFYPRGKISESEVNIKIPACNERKSGELYADNSGAVAETKRRVDKLTGARKAFMIW